MKFKAMALSLVGALLVLSLSACGDKLTADNYGKLKSGMTVEEVKGILGDPTEESGGGAKMGDMDMSGKAMVWKKGDKEVTCTVVNGKVTAMMKKGF